MRFLFFLSVYLLANAISFAKEDESFRDFWHPKYRGERLSYCSLDGKKCGLSIASKYCQLLGYTYADQEVIAYNVGLTNYLFCNARCKGWRCNSFKIIRCIAKINQYPKAHHYRFRRFVYPRFNRYRIDWCYNGFSGCGQKAAFSFCRRMGYLKSSRFKIQREVAATAAIGNQKLCFGKGCAAFRYIDCYR